MITYLGILHHSYSGVHGVSVNDQWQIEGSLETNEGHLPKIYSINKFNNCVIKSRICPSNSNIDMSLSLSTEKDLEMNVNSAFSETNTDKENVAPLVINDVPQEITQAMISLF